ncbi:MAG: patatin-like phospholipase family protein [Deltaproteobacteria bacterium]|nr:patatin-like phospholipase family protein [Deltaproteobacteria bacterium]
MNTITRLIVITLCMGLVACAAPLLNPPLETYDYRHGYRFGNCSTGDNQDELFIALTFSGGGTRAAAFSYGVLKGLQETKVTHNGAQVSLLDEVDLISSVSGGSFTAAYYGLYGEQIFSDFEKRFLKHNVQGDLAVRAFAYPWNWFRLLSPNFSRIDLAAAYYDEKFFNHQTYNGLAQNCHRPFIAINATDLSLGARFEFSQGQFDLLQSDLAGVSVGRAVASSSAFPGLLTPLTMQNYEKSVFVEPVWVDRVIKFDRDISPRRYKYAQEVRSYFDTTHRPYVHLVDGGVSDNIGLRGIIYSLMYPDVLISGDQRDVTDSREFNLQRMIADHKIKKLLIIVVDAKPGEDVHLDQSRTTPGLVPVINAVASAPMANYSFETVQLLREYLKQRRNELRKAPDPFELKTYVMHLRFDLIADPVVRKEIKELGTNFHLPDEAVELLIDQGAKLLHDSKIFQNKFLKDLESQP